ncbi:MAG: hypothetical protein RLZZ126_1512 [Pseudomonadota bacterium]
MNLVSIPSDALDQRLDAWIDEHFSEEVAFLQTLVRIPTDTPPGNNAPHADRTAELLQDMGLSARKFPVPRDRVQAAGLQSITNLLVHRRFGPGKTILLNAHGDVVAPGEGWDHDPYGAEIEGDLQTGTLFGRAAAVSKCDFATYTFALRALEAVVQPKRGCVELLFSYDEEMGGELGPGWMLAQGHIGPDMVVAAGFSYQVVTAHNGCLQMEVTVHGKQAHAAIPHTGVDAIRAAHSILGALYAENARLAALVSGVEGITHPYINVGTISGGTHTNVVPGKCSFKLDRRMIPEEDPAQVEADLRALVLAQAKFAGVAVDVRRLLLANALMPLPGHQTMVQAIQVAARQVFGENIPAIGTPLYTDVRLFAERGIPGVLYGAGPRTVLESHAKRADERLQLADLRRATQVMARALRQLLV